MKLAIDGVVAEMQPDSLNWEQPRKLGTDGQGAPVYATYWTCRLGFSIPVSGATTMLDQWEVLTDGDRHLVTLPHPHTSVLTIFEVYGTHIVPRMNTRGDCASVSGADLTITRIVVT